MIFDYKRRRRALLSDRGPWVNIPMLSIQVKKALLLRTLLLHLGADLFTGMLCYGHTPNFLYRNKVVSFNPHVAWEPHTLFLNWAPGGFFQVTGFFQNVLEFEKLLLLLLRELKGVRV